MFQTNVVTPSRLSCLIAMVLGVQLPSLHAATITYSLDAKSGYLIGPGGVTASDVSSSTDPSNVSAYSGYGFYSNNPNTDGSAAGNNAGWMYSRSGGQGSTYQHYSEIVQNATLTNTAASAMNFMYNFTINWGSLNASNYNFTDATEFSKAGYQVDIKVNGNSVWSSAFELFTDLNGSSFSSSGLLLGKYSAGSQYYSWDLLNSQLNLGTLAAGASMQLSYSIRTLVSGNHLVTCQSYSEPIPTEQGTDGVSLLAATTEPDCGYGDYGDYGSYGEFGYQQFAGYTYAQFGDPNGFDGTANNAGFTQSNIIGQPSGAVSEPGALALVGAGLAGLAFRRRQRKTAV